ncbi:MAG: DUF4080 domain-containing protein [Planctomycetota bacterium]
MSTILLSTLNARYSHASFGLRCLLANMQELQSQTRLVEFTTQDSTTDILAELLAYNPAIIGFGVYIWNVEPLTKLLRDLRQVRPAVCIILGGPEVSYETADQEIVRLADYVITGEADTAFRDLCRQVLAGQPPAERLLHAPLPPLHELQSPYAHYTAEDIAHRVVYVEASRGCPFTCEFCLSALDIPVRTFPLEPFLAALQSLLDRGLRRFKFVDRTFNLNLRISSTILEFFLERLTPDLFLHFELIPDRLPEAIRDIIRRFPPGTLQFEIGIQTFNAATGELISRRQDNTAAERNLQWLRTQTGVHVHADLIAGLPGEDLSSFADGFDRLWRLRPQEIQVGILKRLRGTPILRHDQAWQMHWSQQPPWELLSNQLLPFEELQQIRRFSRYWDLIGNSGNFPGTLRLLLEPAPSPFRAFLQFSEWLYTVEQRRHGIALVRIFERLFEYLTERCEVPAQTAAESLWADYTRPGRRDRPAFLTRFPLPAPPAPHKAHDTPRLPPRQQRHLDGS